MGRSAHCDGRRDSPAPVDLGAQRANSLGDDVYQWVKNSLFRLDAERAHHLASNAARLAQVTCPTLIRRAFQHRDERLSQNLLGQRFVNPVGLAAGFDKNAQLVRFFQELGFGFVEVGSVSARPCKGNPRPRAFRLPDDAALINRMGLNNQGAVAVGARLDSVRRRIEIPVGVNIAKTHDPNIVGEAAIADFVESFRELASRADYIALNVSCPNTREGKTFEDPGALDELLAAIMAAKHELSVTAPVLIKLSPPPHDDGIPPSVDTVIDLALSRGIAGFVATNTASDRGGLVTGVGELERIGRGGLSGAPIKERALRLVRYLYRRVDGRLPIIGVGGVGSAADALERIQAGASLVELYTALVYGGPGLVREISRGLVELLDRHGFSTVHEAVGTGLTTP